MKEKPYKLLFSEASHSHPPSVGRCFNSRCSSAMAEQQSNPPQSAASGSKSYIVSLPREQILRYPPPENAKRMAALTRRDDRRQRRCCRLTLCLLLILVVLSAVSAGVAYLVFNFKFPEYGVTAIGVRGVNLTSSAPFSPGIRVAVSIRAKNANDMVGIYYLKNSTSGVWYGDIELNHGAFPAFYQSRRNVTVVRAALAGLGVKLRGTVMTELRNAQRRRRVPLVVKVEAPIRFEVGSAKTWKMTLKLKCDVVLTSLADNVGILSEKCGHNVRLW